MKTRLILLSFSSFNYYKINKTASFSIHLVPISGYIYSSKLQFLINIKYKKLLRKLQETDTQKVKCNKIIREYENNIIFNCSFETNGGDIDNIEFINFLEKYEFIGQDVDIIALSPFAIKYIDNLQNVENLDLYNKKVSLLDQSIVSINNENWIIDIRGVLNHKTFNYSRINLTIALLSNNSQEKKIDDISCTTEKLYEANVSLNCLAENEMSGELESAVSDLGKDILLVNLLNTSNNTIDFIAHGINNNRFYYKTSKGLSKGTIVAIVLVLSFVVIIIGIMLILFKKKVVKQDKRFKTDSSLYILNEPKL